MEGTKVEVGGTYATPTPGSAGVQSQVGGAATTVSGVAGATGGIGAGNLIEHDLDENLYKFKSDDTPLMQLMLKAKKVKVKSASPSSPPPPCSAVARVRIDLCQSKFHTKIMNFNINNA